MSKKLRLKTTRGKLSAKIMNRFGFPFLEQVIVLGVALLVVSQRARGDTAVPSVAAAGDMERIAGGTFFGSVPDERITRHYYIAAEPVIWNYLPLRRDPICSITGVVQQMSIPRALLERDGSLKLRYFQYTDERFAVRVPQPEWLGILGPVLRGTVGEYLAITFFNRTDRPLSIHPHGVKYDKESEGAAYLPEIGRGGVVPPSGKFTYVWKLDENSGPGPGEPSSKGWLYHSHVSTEQEINLGLVGAIIVTDSARARHDGTPKDVDREVAVFLKTFDEGLVEDDEDEGGLQPPALRPEQRALRLAQSLQMLKRREENERHTINGLSFANLPGLEMRQDERVRWYLFSLGSERDVHSAHWHGTRVIENGTRRTDVIELLPGSMKSADMIADNPGIWLFQCHVGEHMSHGMFCTYRIVGSNELFRARSPAFPGVSPDSLQITSATVSGGDQKGDQIETLHIKANFTLLNLPAFENAPVRVEYDGSSVQFKLVNGRAEQNGQRIAVRMIRAGNGMAGVEFGADLELTRKRKNDGKHGRSELTIYFGGEVLTGAVHL